MLCISVLLVAIGNTIVNVALPTFNRRINASTADLQWIVTAYSLLFTGLFLVAGHLGDRMGRKRTLQVRGRDTVWNPSGHRQASRGVRDGWRGSRWPPARRRPLFFVVCGELAAGAHSPVRSEIKDFGPGRS